MCASGARAASGSLPPAGASGPEAADRPPPVGGGCLKAPAGAASGGRIKPQVFCPPFGFPLRGIKKARAVRSPPLEGAAGKRLTGVPRRSDVR